ncbi:MAG: hypothetical protein LAP40_10080 [Acidobacteriia bacterium]|nr:hypothetical protein [Terriglobia bacterium]
MAASFEFLRGVLGVLCVLFAHMAGRSGAAVRNGQQRVSRLYAWVLRAAACGVALALRHSLDTIALAVWVLAAAAFAAGWWATNRSPKPEDLTHQIFPE